MLLFIWRNVLSCVHVGGLCGGAVRSCVVHGIVWGELFEGSYVCGASCVWGLCGWNCVGEL